MKTKSSRSIAFCSLSLAIMFGLAAVATPMAQAQTFTVVHNFSYSDGTGPGGLTIDSSGNFYGITSGGGANGYGTLWELTSSGTFTVLHNFAYSDGTVPNGIRLNSTGNFYGTTSGGGASGYGTLWELTSSGTFTVLHNFAYLDGTAPRALTIDSSGNFYGTTAGYLDNPAGGADDEGTLWELTSSGEFKVLYNFSLEVAYLPVGFLIAPSGDFYGTTAGGGVDGGYGTVWELTPSGTFAVLHSFNYDPDGSDPGGGLHLDSFGNFYGTAAAGGVGLVGTVWELTPSGTFTVLHAFSFDPDGSDPTGFLIAPSGNFYGIAADGGAEQNGTIWELTPSGAFTVLHAFAPVSSNPGAAGPGGLHLASSGSFYGTTVAGGTDTYGTLWEFTPVISSQTITFAAPASPVTYGVAPITLSATATSGLAVTFSATGPATVSGTTLTVTGAGTVVVTANQAGNNAYSPAPSVSHTIVVNEASQTINFTAPTSPVTYPVSPITLSATATSGLTVTFSVTSGPATVSGTTLTITGVGTVIVTASQTGNAKYAAAPTVSHTIVVLPHRAFAGKLVTAGHTVMNRVRTGSIEI